MLTCRELSEMVSRAQDRKPSLLDRWRMHVHLRVCDGCRNFRDQMTLLRTIIRKHPAVRHEDER
jgi:predicted anti-sigma-YlaC factor YlaD